jgi:hypothetical protein
VLRGEPKLEEPLKVAWQRCLKNFDVLSAVEPGSLGSHEEFAELFLPRRMLTELRGGTEQKFQHVFDVAATLAFEIHYGP